MQSSSNCLLKALACPGYRVLTAQPVQNWDATQASAPHGHMIFLRAPTMYRRHVQQPSVWDSIYNVYMRTSSRSRPGVRLRRPDPTHLRLKREPCSRKQYFGFLNSAGSLRGRVMRRRSLFPSKYDALVDTMSTPGLRQCQPCMSCWRGMWHRSCPPHAMLVIHGPRKTTNQMPSEVYLTEMLLSPYARRALQAAAERQIAYPCRGNSSIISCEPAPLCNHGFNSCFGGDGSVTGSACDDFCGQLTALARS